MSTTNTHLLAREMAEKTVDSILYEVGRYLAHKDANELSRSIAAHLNRELNLEQLLADKERLDWLEKHASFASEKDIHCTRIYFEWCSFKESLRAAIANENK